MVTSTDHNQPGEYKAFFFIERRECIEFICTVNTTQLSGVFYPIHSCSAALPRVRMNWKIRPPRQVAPLGPRDCPQASGCKFPQGAYFPIHPSSRQRIITICQYLYLHNRSQSFVICIFQIQLNLIYLKSKIIFFMFFPDSGCQSPYKTAILMPSPTYSDFKLYRGSQCSFYFLLGTFWDTLFVSLLSFSSSFCINSHHWTDEMGHWDTLYIHCQVF